MSNKHFPQPSDTRESGFTLLELLLVLAVMSVVLAITYPNLNNIIDSLRLRNDAMQLAQEMRAARTEAIMSGQSRDIRFYINYDKYDIVPPNRSIKLSPGISMVDSTFDVDPLFYVKYCRFRATGIPASGGHVRLTNRQGKTKYVIVSSVMGRIRVADTPPAVNE